MALEKTTGSRPKGWGGSGLGLCDLGEACGASLAGGRVMQRTPKEETVLPEAKL